MKRARRTAAQLIYAAPSVDSNILYATQFHAHDPFLYFQVRGKTFAVMSNLEIDRARAEAAVDQVLSLSESMKTLRSRGVKNPGISDVAALLMRSHRVRRARVPGNFPLLLGDEIRAKGFSLEPSPEPFFPRRRRKSPVEIRHIQGVQRATEKAMAVAIAQLRRAKARDGRLWLDGEVLTSERLRFAIEAALLERGCIAEGTIVSGGEQCCQPHHRGSGPLRPNETIIIDVFPRSASTFYFADMTRTVVKGRASDRVRSLYDAVLAAQKRALSSIQVGVSGSTIHRVVVKEIARRGYRTSFENGRWQGFFHGTGHGVGLDLHERPRMGAVGDPFVEGDVVTVEPGLYYPGIGGVRIEDLVVVGKRGARNLTRFPKFLEIE